MHIPHLQEQWLSEIKDSEDPETTSHVDIQKHVGKPATGAL